jgi:hypothetical protein
MSTDFFTAPVCIETARPYLLLDSGAFSSYTKGIEIDIDRYAAYINKVQAQLVSAVTLDSIPGSLADWATPEDAEAECITSYLNFKRIQAQTSAPLMPVVHQYEDERWLWRYIEDEGARFIGISPTDSYPPERRLKWLEHMHWLLDQHGALKEVYTHGFGVLAPRFLREMDGRMWSADASTVMRYCGLRRLFVALDASGEIAPDGPLHDWTVVYVGDEATDPSTRISPGKCADYLDAIGLGDSFHDLNGQLVMPSITSLAAANLHAVRLLMLATGVRCFIAGTDSRVARQMEVERYPYILRSFAHITERTGSTMERLYERRVRP